MIRKNYHGGVLKSIDKKNKVITFVGTNIERDRDGDIIVPEGGRLENFRKNPIFILNHGWSDHEPPIGRSLKERVYPGDRIEFDIQFDASDPVALKYFNKYKNGFMNAVSIGFTPIKYEKINDNIGGYKYLEWELLELSSVKVPANSNALLARALQKQGVDPEYLIRAVTEEVKRRTQRVNSDDDLRNILDILGTDSPEEALRIIRQAEIAEQYKRILQPWK